MKKLLVLLFSILILPISVYASDVYYCSDNSKIGFDRSNNMKIGTFDESRFKIMIDFEKMNISNEKIFYGGVTDQRCVFDNTDATLYCINNYGRTFAINKNSLNYVRSITYLEEIYKSDDYILAHGTCEKF